MRNRKARMNVNLVQLLNTLNHPAEVIGDPDVLFGNQKFQFSTNWHYCQLHVRRSTSNKHPTIWTTSGDIVLSEIPTTSKPDWLPKINPMFIQTTSFSRLWLMISWKINILIKFICRWFSLLLLSFAKCLDDIVWIDGCNDVVLVYCF